MATLTCPLCCGEKFENFDTLKQHILQILENLTCTNCNNSFTDLIDFIQHLNDDNCRINDRINNNNEFVDLKMGSVLELEREQCKNNDNNEDEDVTKNSGTLELFDKTILCNDDDREQIDENLTEIENLGDYYCQMCGIHFNEIEEHLRDFHEGQQIIVEDDHNDPPMETNEPNRTETIYLLDNTQIILDNIENNDKQKDDEIDRDTIENDDKEDDEDQEINEENVKDKDGRLYTRKFVKIDKFWLESTHDNKEPIIQQYIIDNGEVKRLTNDEIDTIDDKSSIIEINQCPDCNLLFTNYDNYKKHKCDSCSNSNEKHECSDCNLNFNDLEELRKHLKQHDDENNGQKKVLVNCETCNTTFSTFKSLRLHRRMHDPVKEREIEAPVKYDINDVLKDEDQLRPMFFCKICNKSYDKQYLDVHVESHNSTDGYNCQTCNRKFFSQANLEMHLKAHSNNKKFACSYCKKPFITYEALQEHLCKERMYACQYCGRRFVRPHEKVKHERIHTGEKPHVCGICGKAFRVNYCLTLHLRTHSGARPYQCFTCGKRFKSHSVYNHHLLTHSETRNYKCPFCPKAFKTSVQLAGHKNSHTKPFTCTECNRPFASLYAVRAHMETHKRDNNLRYECWMCGALYSRAFALRDHMKQQHQDNSGDGSGNGGKSKVLNVVEEEIDATNSILVKEDDIILGLEGATNIEIIEDDCR